METGFDETAGSPPGLPQLCHACAQSPFWSSSPKTVARYTVQGAPAKSFKNLTCWYVFVVHNGEIARILLFFKLSSFSASKTLGICSPSLSFAFCLIS